MWSIVYNLFFLPIEYVIELVYAVAFRIMNNQGLSIILVSVAVQFLVWPLYKKADSIQEKERAVLSSMEKYVSHIKKNFSGNERYMMLSAYYREHHYKPVYALRGSVSLLLQVPFFIAAYNYLSGLTSLNGVSFLFVRDLSAPDGFFKIGNISVNLLPVLMTTINITSSVVYAKGFSLKEKLQLYAMALIFLVLLYNSPSGLVLYWTVNNLFSLIKNIVVRKVKDPLKTMGRLSAVFGIIMLILAVSFRAMGTYSRILIVILLFLLLMTPYLCYLVRQKIIKVPVLFSKINKKFMYQDIKPLRLTFLLSCALLSVLVGLYIPLTVISSSPLEFVFSDYGPGKLVINTLSVSVGMFFFLPFLFFCFLQDRSKSFLSLFFACVAVCAVVDYFFFEKDFGLISPFLIYDNTFSYSFSLRIINLLCILLIVPLICFVFLKKKKILNYILSAVVVGLAVISIINVFKVADAVSGYTQSEEVCSGVNENKKIFSLSKKGKNVVFIMLDRAVSGLIPYMFEEKEELRNAFRDFTYYPNTVTFGGVTLYAAPSLFGGYEYTPDKIQRQPERKLVDKHDEALSVLPVLFMNNNYKVTVCDPPYAGYNWKSDLSIYNDYPSISAYRLYDSYYDRVVSLFEADENNVNVFDYHLRNMFFYSLMKVMPLVWQRVIYDRGCYLSLLDMPAYLRNRVMAGWYAELFSLPEITQIDEDGDTFLMLQNSLTHEPETLSYPDYDIFGISGYRNSKDDDERFLSDGKILPLDYEFRKESYHVNMASMLLLARWLEYLKENDVYDNTRIIIASDHGSPLNQFKRIYFDNDYDIANSLDLEFYNPLLLVKDFSDSLNYDKTKENNKLKTENSFMTIADCPSLVVEGIIDSPVNPFTGKEINMDEKQFPQIITTSNHGAPLKGFEYQFDLSDGFWCSVHDDIFDNKNWVKLVDYEI